MVSKLIAGIEDRRDGEVFGRKRGGRRKREEEEREHRTERPRSSLTGSCERQDLQRPFRRSVHL
jgi:hypothetical protein